MLPNLITVGNAVCGFVALTYVAEVRVVDGQLVNPQNFTFAAWFILLGMVFDVFDGRVARMTGATTELGAQLDSMCDLVTFGLAPAGLMVKLHQAVLLHAGEAAPWGKMVWVFGLLYFIGAMLRLARFNLDTEPEEEHHQCFEGMPTPAAAGTVATLVLVYGWLREWKSWELQMWGPTPPSWAPELANFVPAILPFVAFFLGVAMVSPRFNYPHAASRLLERHSYNDFVTLVFAVILTFFLVEPMLCLLFLGYTVWTPLQTTLAWARGQKPTEVTPEP